MNESSAALFNFTIPAVLCIGPTCEAGLSTDAWKGACVPAVSDPTPTPFAAATVFCMWGRTMDVIKHAKCQVNRFRGLGAHSPRPQIAHLVDSSELWKCKVKCMVNASEPVNCSTQHDEETLVTVARPSSSTWSWCRLADLRLGRPAQYDFGWHWRRCKVWSFQTVDALIKQQSSLVSYPLSDWQPTQLLQNLLHPLVAYSRYM